MMQLSVSPQIATQYVDGELRFDLPVRPLGPVRWLGVVLIAFGILFLWGPAHDLAESVQEIQRDGAGLAQIAFALFELIFVAAGLVPIALGAWFMAGRCQIGWSPERLRTTEILGPLRWTRRMPREPVSRLAVSAASSRSSDASPPQEFEGFAALMVEFASGTKKLLAIGYPKPMLLKLAEQLKSYVGGGRIDVETQMPGDEPGDDLLLKQPQDSNVRVEDGGTDLRFVVPPAGLVRGSSGLFAFSIIWCLFTGVISAGFIYADWSGGDEIPWFVWATMIGFWGVGVAMLLGALNMGRRTAVISVMRQRLLVETRSLLGSKRREWAPGEVVAVRVGPSGMEVNDKPVLELQIYPASGKKMGLLAGRDGDELRWIAVRLRRSLAVGRFAPAGNELAASLGGRRKE